MNINNYADLEVMIFCEKLQEALRAIEELAKTAVTSNDRMVLCLKKVQVLRQMADYTALCQILREILVVDKTKSLDWPAEVIAKLFEAFLDGLLVCNNQQEFDTLLDYLSHSSEAILTNLAGQYKNLKSVPVSPVEPEVSSSAIHEVTAEFKELPTVVELSLHFTHPHFSMKGFSALFDTGSNTLTLLQAQGKALLELTLKEKVASFTWNFNEKSKGLALKFGKGEPNKVWKGLTVVPEHSFPSFVQLINVSDYVTEAQKAAPKKQEKNWDKIVEAEEVIDLKEKNYDCDPAMHFFKQVYENADEESRRAMLKSFSESNGKVLSTNWGEVKDKDFKKEDEPTK